MVPFVRVILPATDQVLELMDIEGTPEVALEKLMEPVILTVGLLVTQSRVSAPAKTVWTKRLPVSVRLPNIITTT